MKKIIGWVKDYAYLFSAGAFTFFKHTPPEHYLKYTKDGKVPIIILPGLSMRWAFYKSMADHISLLGHPVYIIPKLGNNWKDLLLLNDKKVWNYVIEWIEKITKE